MFVQLSIDIVQLTLNTVPILNLNRSTRKIPNQVYSFELNHSILPFKETFHCTNRIERYRGDAIMFSRLFKNKRKLSMITLDNIERIMVQYGFDEGVNKGNH